ncbi:MAG: alkaline phosphatase D family protein, partial [Thermoleophilaceae bacterium]
RLWPHNQPVSTETGELHSCWDDHEVQNTYSGGDPDGGDADYSAIPVGIPQFPPFQYSVKRRDAAYRAFFQSMPTFTIGRQRLYHKATFGRHVDLFVLDERQYRSVASRRFLGADQSEFLRSGLTQSSASWKVIANAVMIMGGGGSDSWEGFPAEREALLGVISQNEVQDVVFITGDMHACIAGDVQNAAEHTVATEFVCGSMTTPSTPEGWALIGRPGYGTADNPTMPQAEYDALNRPYYEELDFFSHGYVLCEAGAQTFKATYKKLETVRRESTALKASNSYTLHRGTPGL